MLNHIRVPDKEQRYFKYGLEAWKDERKRRFYLYFRGKLVSSLSFSESEWASMYPDNAVAAWMSAKSHEEDVDHDSEDERDAQKVIDDFNERVAYGAKEHYKYGVKGSQAPGTCSIVIDGNKK